MHDTDDNQKVSFENHKFRNRFLSKKPHPIHAFKDSSLRSSFSSGDIDLDKQENISTKKFINFTSSSLPKITKNLRKTHYININKRLINDLNYQINTTNKKIFGNLFSYKHTINLQEINDYILYEKTKKSIDEHKKIGKKIAVDFRLPIAYRRMNNHYKKEDLIPIKMKPRINLEDILYMHNSILRKSVSQNNCRKYYLKNNMKLINEYLKDKYINKNKPPKIIKFVNKVHHNK